MQSLIIVLLFFLLYKFCSSSPSCLHNIDGKFYNGIVNITASGKVCKSWSYAKNIYSLGKLKIKNYEDNFCRNPNRSLSVWCYTGKNAIEFCHVPMCSINPDANYCIAIPRIHFKICPTMFFKMLIFKDFGLKEIIFCCASNNTEVKNLLPKDSCVIVIVPANTLNEHFTTCPNGFSSTNIKDNVLESNVIYKCCKSIKSSNKVIERIKDLTSRHNNVETLLGFILSKDTLCPMLKGLLSTTIEYHGMDEISKGILPSKMILCLYIKNVTKAMLNYSQLGFMTLKECPMGFVQADVSLSTFMYGTSEFRYCWPKYRSNLYSSETFCLNVKDVLANSTSCPENFYAYDILSALEVIPLSKICCRTKSYGSNFDFTNVNITNQTSMAFMTLNNECPSYKSNTAMKSFNIQTFIKKRNLYNSTYKGNIQQKSLDPIFSVCVYEYQKDEFAYKKVGNLCPKNMFNSRAVYKSKTYENNSLLNNETVIEICIGNGHFTLESFPKGRYCLYKINKHCPLGFKSKFLSQMKLVIDKISPVKFYNINDICCRNDSDYNQTILFGSLPFIYSNESISFGLPLLNHFELCSKVEGFIDYNDFDFDEPFCSYRSEEDYLRWRHEIILPDYADEVLSNDIIKNFTVIKPWTRNNIWTYRSSVLHKYPKNEFCILSSGGCSFVKDLNFILKYPIKGFFICCHLRNAYSMQESLTSFQFFNISSNFSVGYLAVNGKCPTVDQNILRLRYVVHDTFQIKIPSFESEYGINLMKIGIIPNISYIKQIIRVDFKFCIFQHSPITNYEDVSRNETFIEFIKPIHSFCPLGYKEIQKNISLNKEMELDPLAKHFFNGFSLTICIPLNVNARDQRFIVPSSLCRVSQMECPSSWIYLDLNIKTFTTHPLYQPLYVCCSKEKRIVYTSESFPQQFALPLNPGESKCPRIQNFSSSIMKVLLSKSSYLNEVTFCFYYHITNLTYWPSGSYLTISYEDQCPLGFHLAKYNGSSLCMRQDTRPSLQLFPLGNYCILTFINKKCPPMVTWRSSFDFIGLDNSIVNLCCSLSNNIIFNIPLSNEKAFAFISIDKCSLIPGMQIKEANFFVFHKIIQCIYTKNVCYEWSITKCIKWKLANGTKESENVSLMKRQNIIIGLLVSVLFVVLTFGVILILFNRIKLGKRNINMNSSLKLSAIYTQIDCSINYEEKENSDEDVPSVTYNTIL